MNQRVNILIGCLFLLASASAAEKANDAINKEPLTLLLNHPVTSAVVVVLIVLFGLYVPKMIPYFFRAGLQQIVNDCLNHKDSPLKDIIKTEVAEINEKTYDSIDRKLKVQDEKINGLQSNIASLTNYTQKQLAQNDYMIKNMDSGNDRQKKMEDKVDSIHGKVEGLSALVKHVLQHGKHDE